MCVVNRTVVRVRVNISPYSCSTLLTVFGQRDLLLDAASDHWHCGNRAAQHLIQNVACPINLRYKLLQNQWQRWSWRKGVSLTPSVADTIRCTIFLFRRLKRPLLDWSIATFRPVVLDLIDL